MTVIAQVVVAHAVMGNHSRVSKLSLLMRRYVRAQLVVSLLMHLLVPCSVVHLGSHFGGVNDRGDRLLLRQLL